MSFLSTVKHEYHKKVLQNLIDTNKFDVFIQELLNLKKDNNIYFNLSKKFIPEIISTNKFNLTKPKIVWTNSFLSQDLEYLIKFINFYISKTSKTISNVNSLSAEIFSIQQTYKYNEIIDFQKFAELSFLFQWLLISNSDESDRFISNQLPFFSSTNGYNFSTSQLTKCYIYIIDHPYNIFQKLKTIFNSDVDKARNYMFNVDGTNTLNPSDNPNFNPLQQGWQIHSQSLQDSNVINSLRGKIIMYEDLINDKFETLSSIILHLIQSEVNLDLRYDVIEEFISQNQTKSESYENGSDKLSNKEKKFIASYLHDVNRINNFKL